MKSALFLAILLMLTQSSIAAGNSPAEQRKEKITPYIEQAKNEFFLAAQDGKITSAEMQKIEDISEIFQMMREDAITIYGDDMKSLKLPWYVQKTINLYQNPVIREGAGINQPKIKKIFAEITGKDVTVVEERWSTDSIIGFMVTCIVCFVLAYILRQNFIFLVFLVLGILILCVLVILILVAG